MNRRKNILIVFLLILQVVSVCIFYNIDKIKLMQEGLRYQLFNMNYSISFQTINSDVCFDIDINNLDSNIHTIIYENDGCTIMIDSIIKKDEKYIIYFSSHGIYDQQQGKLITGVEHKVLSNKKIEDKIYASCFIGNIECQNNSFSGLNFKDGDEFSFIIDAKSLESVRKVTLKNLLLIKMEKM
ncbi:hypothetical protein [Thomasclavelia cocleata]|uniref:hypothetical protein n=5 Tax=Thomasclavelia cocleata TaxID=69824 RepID=UPI0025784502|nr:hypothetical protein [Thomasclavelia cocleata]